jgi:hypothetical protein
MKRFGSIPVPTPPTGKLVYVAFGTFAEGRYIRFPQGRNAPHPRTLLILYPDGSAGRVHDYNGPNPMMEASKAERFPAGSVMAKKVKEQFEIWHPHGANP